jgi:hypothetical protein
MGRYRSITVEAEVSLDEFDTEDLVEELEDRGVDYNTKDVDSEEMRALLEQIWLKRRNGRTDYQRDLDDLIWGVLGKMA